MVLITSSFPTEMGKVAFLSLLVLLIIAGEKGVAADQGKTNRKLLFRQKDIYDVCEDAEGYTCDAKATDGALKCQDPCKCTDEDLEDCSHSDRNEDGKKRNIYECTCKNIFSDDESSEVIYGNNTDLSSESTESVMTDPDLLPADSDINDEDYVYRMSESSTTDSSDATDTSHSNDGGDNMGGLIANNPNQPYIYVIDEYHVDVTYPSDNRGGLIYGGFPDVTDAGYDADNEEV